MFGYIRPMQSELKVRELERFKACYCGLCHALGKKYGLAARFVLSYELVFLSMLLWDVDDTPEIKYSRCIVSPCVKKRYCAQGEALGVSAGYNVILSWWKLKDTIADETAFKSIRHRILAIFLYRAYKKAAREFPEFDDKVREETGALAGYEAQFRQSRNEREEKSVNDPLPDGNSSSGISLDNAADKFASILRAAVPEAMPDNKRRPLLELLYHLGRWIYLVDACDDYRDDVKHDHFNPVALRFTPEGGKIPDAGLSRLKTTLSHSNNLLCAAFELIDENTWSDTVRNVIYLGMPDVCKRVLEGEFDIGRRYHP